MSDTKLDQLLDFLELDPQNPSLLLDCANAAIEEKKIEKASELFSTLNSIEPLKGQAANTAGIALMRTGQFDAASDIFNSLLDDNPDDLNIQFNLAWAASLSGDNEKATELLNQNMIETIAQAAMLKLQITHDNGDFDKAALLARDYLVLHNQYAPLLAAISTLAMDIEDIDLARESAHKAGDIPEAMTTLATLCLGDQDNETAREMFQKVLQVQNKSPRAWVGLGLSSLAMGDSASAGPEIDKGAEIFENHLGSWIAAGWAYFIAKDYLSARERFERAFSYDPNFAESHGSLAVMDVIDNDIESAKRRITVALKLDRQCFSAAYAKMLIAQSLGQDEKAQKILDNTLSQSFNAEGNTIAQAIAKLATSIN